MVSRSKNQHLITFVVGIACAFVFTFVDAGKNPLDTFTLLRGGTLDDERSSEAEENKKLDAYIEALIASVEEEEVLDEADGPGDDDETEQLLESESQNNSNADGGLDEIVAIVGSGVPSTATRPEDAEVVDNDDDDDDVEEDDDEAETVPNHNDAKVEGQVNIQTPSEPADLLSTETSAEEEEEEEQEEEEEAEDLEKQQKESVDDDDDDDEEEEEEEKQEEIQEEQQKESVDDDDEEEEQQEEKHEEQRKESVDDEEEEDEQLESVAKEDSVVEEVEEHEANDDGGDGDEPVEESSPATPPAAAKQDSSNEQDSALPVPSSTTAAPRAVYQRPNAVYRFFLNQGRIGHIVVMILISIAEFFRNYFPDVANLVSAVLESLGGGGRTAADRRLQEEQQVDTKQVNEQYAGFVAQERTSVRGKKRKQALQKADAKAAEQLRRLGSVGNAKYRHVSEAFLRRHGLGRYANLPSGETDQESAVEEGEEEDDDYQEQDEVDEDVDWVVKALTADKPGTPKPTATGTRRKRRRKKRSMSIDPSMSVGVNSDGSTSLSVGVGFSFGSDGKSKSKKKKNKRSIAVQAATASDVPKKKRPVVPRASDREGGGGVMGRIRDFGANNLISRSLMGAYPGDALPPGEAASAGGLADLATKYGYGDWSDGDDDYDEEPVPRRRKQKKKKKKKTKTKTKTKKKKKKKKATKTKQGPSKRRRTRKKKKTTTAGISLEIGLASSSSNTRTAPSSRGFGGASKTRGPQPAPVPPPTAALFPGKNSEPLLDSKSVLSDGPVQESAEGADIKGNTDGSEGQKKDRKKKRRKRKSSSSSPSSPSLSSSQQHTSVLGNQSQLPTTKPVEVASPMKRLGEAQERIRQTKKDDSRPPTIPPTVSMEPRMERLRKAQRTAFQKRIPTVTVKPPMTRLEEAKRSKTEEKAAPVMPSVRSKPTTAVKSPMQRLRETQDKIRNDKQQQQQQGKQ